MAVVVEYLDTLRLHKKRRRYADNTPSPLATLPAEWRELLVQWLRLGGNSRWETLLKKAGIAQKTTAETLLEWLLNNGWVVVDEVRQHGDWWPYRVELQNQKTLRHQFGLPDMDDVTMHWQSLRSELQVEAENNVHLHTALATLDGMPLNRAINRAMLVKFLLTWEADERVGTYRDFSLYARGATKEISKTEWDWLDTHFDLTELNIEQHTPLLMISADLTLRNTQGEMQLKISPDFAALTPTTVSNIQSASGNISAWILVENRTSFERIARKRQAYEAVVWLPGFPPSWWQTAMRHLLSIAPAPAQVSCDPDPAGIAIALSVIRLWQSLDLHADAFYMDVRYLENIAQPQTLNQYDQQLLEQLLSQDLPNTLYELATYIKTNQIKGEQEAYL